MNRTRSGFRVALLVAAAVVAGAPALLGTANAAKVDPCTQVGGTATYSDVLGTGLAAPTLNLVNNFGTNNPGNASKPLALCSGYSYTVTFASADGSSLGWSTSSQTTGSTSNVSSTSVQFTLVGTGSNTLDFTGSTTAYSGAPAGCGGAPGLLGSVTITSPKGRMSYWPAQGQTKSLCETGGSGGNNYYG